MTDDIVARAKAALEGITAGPWRYCRGSSSDPAIMIDGDTWGSGGGLRVAVEDMMEDDGVDPCDIRAWVRDATFIAQSPELVAELVAEVEWLRSDPTLALMGSQLRKGAVERAQLKATVERLRESGDRLAAMLDECASVIEPTEAERDELRATVGRVRAYLERRVRDTAWAETAPCVSPREIEIFHFEIREIRAALDGDDGKGEA